MSAKLNSGSLFPRFTLERMGGGMVIIGGERGRWQLVIVYRGRHCQLAKPFLARLNEMVADFAERNIDLVAISADWHDCAETCRQKFTA